MSSKSRFLKAVSVGEFIALLDSIVLPPLENERLPLARGLGRILAENITSSIDVPSFPKSSVDGYALVAKSTFGANEGRPLACHLCGSVEMGRAPPVSLSSSTDCVYVPTGGSIPDGADAVIKIEFTKVSGTAIPEILVYQAVVPGDGVVAAGADIKKGSMLLKSGSVLTPARLGSIAATGLTSVLTWKKLSVGLFSSGNEIVEPGKPLTPGKIYDVNSVLLTAMLESAGCMVNFHGVLVDEMSTLAPKFARILDQSDVVICSGGTSKGKGDLMPAIIEQHPATSMQVHGVRIKPGKPIIMAILGGKPVFVLPGNPVSAAMTMTRLVQPALRRWNGLPPIPRVVTSARLTERVYSEFGRLELKPVVLDRAPDGTWIAKPVQKGSETITTLVDASGYFEIAENVEIVDKETIVAVILYNTWEKI